MAGVLGTADAAVADAEALNGTLADIQSFLGSNVDAPGLDASLECLRPWLDALPDVPTLLGTLDGAQTLLRGTVLPSLLRLQSGVGQLAADVGTAAAPGTATAALAHAATSRAGAVTLVAQAQALVDAAGALPAAAGAAGAAAAMGALRDATTALLSDAAGDAADLAAKAALLEALATDLEALAATAGTLGDVAAALDALAPAATRLLNETLPALVAAFQGVQEGYGGVEPCVNALLAAAERVEARVLALPAALRGQLALLGEVHSALRTLSNVTTDWGAEVDGLADRLDVDAVLGGLRSPLQSMQGRLAGLGNLTATAQTLRDTAATMEAGEGALRTLRTLAAAAVALSPDATSYDLARAAGGAVADQLAGDVGSLGEGVGALFDAADSASAEAQALAADPSPLTSVLASPDGTIPAALALIAEVPEPASYADEAAQLAQGYAELPSPPGGLVDQAKAEIASMLSGVDQVAVAGRKGVRRGLLFSQLWGWGGWMWGAGRPSHQADPV